MTFCFLRLPNPVAAQIEIWNGNDELEYWNVSLIWRKFILMYWFIKRKKNLDIYQEGHYGNIWRFLPSSTTWLGCQTFLNVLLSSILQMRKHMNLSDFSRAMQLGFGRARIWTQEPRIWALSSTLYCHSVRWHETGKV